MDKQYLEAVSQLNGKLKEEALKLEPSLQETVSEIRVCYGSEIRITQRGASFFIGNDGRLTKNATGSYIVTEEDIEESLFSLCQGSVHSHIKELVEGYITTKGGHRVGVSGIMTYDEKGIIKSVRKINSYVIRIARQFEGISDMLAFLFEEKAEGLIIASEPSGGKTTLLCDLARRLSLKYDIAVIDERKELSDRLKGSPISVVTGVKKSEGIVLAIRSLSPQIIICDEITDSENEAVISSVNSGVSLITTIHAGSAKEFAHKKVSKALLDSGAFKHIAFLKGRHAPSEVREVLKVVDVKEWWNCSHNSRRGNARDV